MVTVTFTQFAHLQISGQMETQDYTYEAGETVELDDRAARAFIEQGIAIPVKSRSERATAPAGTAAVRTGARTRRPKTDKE